MLYDTAFHLFCLVDISLLFNVGSILAFENYYYVFNTEREGRRNKGCTAVFQAISASTI